MTSPKTVPALDEIAVAEAAKRAAMRLKYSQAFDLVQAKLADRFSLEDRQDLAAILRELIESVDYLDESMSKRGLAYVASILEFGVGHKPAV